MTDQAQRTAWALQQFTGFVNAYTPPALQRHCRDEIESVRRAIRAIASPEPAHPVVGYAVFAVESLFERTLAAMAYRLLTLRELQLALAALGTPIPERTLRDWRAKGKLLPARREPDVLFLFADARRLAEDWGVRKGMTA